MGWCIKSPATSTPPFWPGNETWQLIWTHWVLRLQLKSLFPVLTTLQSANTRNLLLKIYLLDILFLHTHTYTYTHTHTHTQKTQTQTNTHVQTHTSPPPTHTHIPSVLLTVLSCWHCPLPSGSSSAPCGPPLLPRCQWRWENGYRHADRLQQPPGSAGSLADLSFHPPPPGHRMKISHSSLLDVFPRWWACNITQTSKATASFSGAQERGYQSNGSYFLYGQKSAFSNCMSL